MHVGGDTWPGKRVERHCDCSCRSQHLEDDDDRCPCTQLGPAHLLSYLETIKGSGEMGSRTCRDLFFSYRHQHHRVSHAVWLLDEGSRSVTTEVLNVDNGLYCGEDGHPPTSEGRFGCLSRKIEPNWQGEDFPPSFSFITSGSKDKLVPEFPQGVQDRTAIASDCRSSDSGSPLRTVHNGICIHVKSEDRRQLEGKASKHMRTIHTITGYENERERFKPSLRGRAEEGKVTIVAPGSCSDPGIWMQIRLPERQSYSMAWPIRIWTTPPRQFFHMLTDADSNSGGVVVDGSRRLEPGRDDLPNKVSVTFFPPSCARILVREASASYKAQRNPPFF